MDVVPMIVRSLGTLRNAKHNVDRKHRFSNAPTCTDCDLVYTTRAKTVVVRSSCEHSQKNYCKCIKNFRKFVDKTFVLQEKLQTFYPSNVLYYIVMNVIIIAFIMITIN